MTLGEYYRNKHHGVSFEAAIQKVHDNIHSMAYSQKSVEECKKLQDFLNQAFYPEKYGTANGQDYSQAISSLISKAYEEKYNAALNNFSMGKSGVGYGNITMDTLPTLVRDKHESFQHTSKMYVSTITDRLQRVKTALQKAENILGPELESYRRDLLSLYQQLTYLEQMKGVAAGQDKRGAYFDLQGANSNLIDAINKMDKEFAAASAVGGIFTPYDYGQVLEWILQAFSNHTEERAEQIGNALVEEFTKTAGSEKTSGTGNDLIKIRSTEVKLNKTDIAKTEVKGEGTSLSLSDENGNKFSFHLARDFNPDKDRQGKMDVEFLFNTDARQTIPFRISAKNWQTLDRDFGETNVIYALLRSAGNESAVEYALAMQDKNSSNTSVAHRLVKYSLLVDILMGYSQANNYADTIVINVRSEQRVIVASIIDIVDQINADLDKFNLSGYQDSTIETRMRAIRAAIHAEEGVTEQYLALGMKYLQSIKVKLMYANIAYAIRTPESTVI